MGSSPYSFLGYSSYSPSGIKQESPVSDGGSPHAVNLTGQGQAASMQDPGGPRSTYQGDLRDMISMYLPASALSNELGHTRIDVTSDGQYGAMMTSQYGGGVPLSNGNQYGGPESVSPSSSGNTLPLTHI